MQTTTTAKNQQPQRGESQSRPDGGKAKPRQITERQRAAIKLLNKHGYTASTKGGEIYGQETVLVDDPVQCSNGEEEWIEYVTRRVSINALHLFLAERS